MKNPAKKKLVGTKTKRRQPARALARHVRKSLKKRSLAKAKKKANAQTTSTWLRMLPSFE